MQVALPELLERIVSLGRQSPYEFDRRNLLYAYVACFNFSALCMAMERTINEDTDVRLALRGRLLRLLREEQPEEHTSALVNLVEQTAIAADKDKSLRPPADALHSAVFQHLPLQTKQMLLDRWIDRGTHGAAARWLKATKNDLEMFDAEFALAYWRTSKDSRAAKSLAYQASPKTLANLVPELIGACDEGWIVSKAVLRAGYVDEGCWELIRAKHPATYLYLCAQTGRQVTDNEAFDLVCRCSGLAINGNRGLAIWAVGQMRMILVLDRLQNTAQELQQRDKAGLLAHVSSIT